MNKNHHSILQDENLRKALRQEEAALPQMPADLNDRLMKRLHHEKRQRHFTIWPWVAAACVAAVMVVVLLPSKKSYDETIADSGEMAAQTNSLATEKGTKNDQQETKDMESKTMAQDGRIANPDTRGRRIANSTEREERKRIAAIDSRIANPDTHGRRIANSTEREEQSETTQMAEIKLVREESADQSKEMAASGEMAPADLPRTQAKPQQTVLTERDIPISRPENYRYTPEELALMRRQADAAYVKWMELELEIMKYQYEQIAKQ